MKIANETGQEVYYFISNASMADCGTIEIDGIADLPGYDNQSNVEVFLSPVGATSFVITTPQTKTDEQMEMCVKAE